MTAQIESRTSYVPARPTTESVFTRFTTWVANIRVDGLYPEQRDRNAPVAYTIMASGAYPVRIDTVETDRPGY